MTFIMWQLFFIIIIICMLHSPKTTIFTFLMTVQSRFLSWLATGNSLWGLLMVSESLAWYWQQKRPRPATVHHVLFPSRCKRRAFKFGWEVDFWIWLLGELPDQKVDDLTQTVLFSGLVPNSLAELYCQSYEIWL